MVFDSFPSFYQTISVLATFYALKFAYQWYSSTKKPKEVQIQKKDWKKDVVYLYQFPKTPFLPNLSPFCLKVETFLRVFKIQHEIMPTTLGVSKKGLKPFIELNGEHIADSQFIILHLKKHFKIDENCFTAEQKAVQRAFDRLLDGSFVYSGNLLKMEDHWEDYTELCLAMNFGPMAVNLGKKLFAMLMKKKVYERFTAEGTARHSRQEIISIIKNDLEAIQTYLGDKPYFLGDVPSTTDAVLFGHLAAVYFVPYRHVVKEIIEQEYSKVLDYVKRIGKQYYPEYEFKN